MIRAIISFLASIFTAIQVFFIYNGDKGICFNEGCEVVDSMTTVSPLFFNIAGFLFFQTLFWLFLKGRQKTPYWHKLARLLLLAGLAAEAVLIFFQHAILSIFCSYCLIIFFTIVLLNICCGLRQLFRGIVIFFAVSVALFSLQFKAAGNSGETLVAGSMAVLGGSKNDVQLYLLYSASCVHCEKVIAEVGRENACTIHFNPVEKIDELPLPAAVRKNKYDPSINRALLSSLSMNEVPVLVAVVADETRAFKGEKRIREYLGTACQQPRDGGLRMSTSSPGFVIPGITQAKNDACQVSAECETNDGTALPKEQGQLNRKP